jgi:hypothetical protein
MTKTRSYLLSVALAGSLGMNALTLAGAGINATDASPEPVNAQCTVGDEQGKIAALAGSLACARMRIDNPDITECGADGLHDIHATRQPMDPADPWSVRVEGVFAGVRTIVESP